ncbi:MAG: Lrp/AsnC family transcriptional regulator [Saprospiraceae bacterium]|jgi:DNA-binding Lrp family transcriptional regulator|nr:Lrp/AsnC family transcriptional regulator [Saprospiraceae bacterium]
MKPLDPTDLRILNLLQEDAHLTNKEIAAELGLTTTPVFERVKRLEDEGYIHKYVALVDRSKLDYTLAAFCNVQLKEHARSYLKQFEDEVRSLREVIECYHIAGMFDYLLKVVVKDMNAYQDFIVNKLAVLDNIGNVQSSFVMTEVKYSTRLWVEG